MSMFDNSLQKAMINLPNLRIVRHNVSLLVCVSEEEIKRQEKEKHGWPQQPFLEGAPTSVHYTRSGCQGRSVHWPWPHPPLWLGIASGLIIHNTQTQTHTHRIETQSNLMQSELHRRLLSLYPNLMIYNTCAGNHNDSQKCQCFGNKFGKK